MAVLLDQLVETLSHSGLMTAGDVREFLDGLGADKKPETGEDLAKLLVRHDKLTKFQAQCIYQGKTKGLVFDEYTVLDKIGQGGMGVVLKAQHRRMKRLVAVKMLPAAALKDKEAVNRFYREVEAAARLTHPNIVTAHDAREHAGTHYLVMEYVEGKDLAELLAERGPLPVGQAVNCVIQAAKGLEYAHKQGIIHRDIKPSNLLLDREATVKILDMGLARIFEGEGATGSDRLTGSGQVMGTCDYMAPEQAEDTHGADHRADVYSLGCTLYRLLTGEKPYQGDTMIQVLMAHRAAEIPSAREFRSDVPEAVDDVCRKMMAKTPEDRYQSMTEVLAALETCVAVKTPVPSPVADESSSDGALTSFLQSLPKGGVATKKKAARVAEDTFKSHLEQDTSSNIWTRLVPTDRRQMWTYAGIAGGAALLVVLLGVILMLKTPEGTLVVEIDQPDALVQVLDEQGKVEIDLRNDKGTVSIGVDPGDHRLKVEKDGFEFYTEDFTMESGGKVAIAAKLVPLVDKGVQASKPRHDGATATPRQVVGDPAPTEPDSMQAGHLLSNGWRIGEPVNLGPAVNSSADEKSPHLSRDGLMLLFSSNRAGGLGRDDLWMCRRASMSEPFGKPVNLGPTVNSDGLDSGPCLSADALTLVFSSTRDGGQGREDLWMCRRSSPSESFGAPVNLGPTVNFTTGDGEPCLSADGLTLIFRSTANRPGGIWQGDLWICSRVSPSEPFGKPANLGSPVNSSAIDHGPALSADGLTLVFDRSRYRRQLAPDLWMCTRRSANGLFGECVSLGPTVNTDADEKCPALSSDCTTLLFQSDRPGGHGGNDLWMAKIEPPVVPKQAQQPPLAIAPFDATEAKQHQQAWGDYLGLPVEQDVDLGDGVKLTMVLIPPGEFLMGSTAEEQARVRVATDADERAGLRQRVSSEGPQHRVKIIRPFYLGKYEVTQAQWEAVIGSNPSSFQPSTNPVKSVSWDAIQPFLEELNERAEMEGMEFVLPTETQWEYACRAGTITAWHYGDTEVMLPEFASFHTNAKKTTRPVGTLKPNAWGLYDMHGNVAEWCADWHSSDYYANSPMNDPKGPLTGSERAARGGSWFSFAWKCRSASRNHKVPDRRYDYIGLRLAAVFVDE